MILNYFLIFLVFEKDAAEIEDSKKGDQDDWNRNSAGRHLEERWRAGVCRWTNQENQYKKQTQENST